MLCCLFASSANSPGSATRRGASLLQLLAVVAIVGILSAVVWHRVFLPRDTVRQNACYVLKGEIELQTQLWFRRQGSWPATDLSDIGANADYFPEGLPTCPVDGSAYSIDSNTHRVLGHTH